MLCNQIVQLLLVFLRRDRLELDHACVAPALESPDIVQHEGNASGHACRKIATGSTEHHHHPTGHVFAAVIARAFDDRPCPAVSHSKPLPAIP